MRSTVSPQVSPNRLSLQGVPTLVVTSDPTSAAVVVALLESHACEVHVARTAEEGLALLARLPARLVVMDLLLPELSALVMVRRLKTNPSTREAVVVALSTFDSRTVDAMAMDAGCAACIRKPIDPRTFVPKLAALLGDRR